MFDANFFLKGVAWLFALAGTFSTIAGLGYLWWSTFTKAGQEDALRDLVYRRRVYRFSFKPVAVAVIGWIAVASFY